MATSEGVYDYFRQNWGRADEDASLEEKKSRKTGMKKSPMEKKKSGSESPVPGSSSKLKHDTFEFKNLQRRFAGQADILHRLGEVLETEDDAPTSSSEKERGNMFFKDGKYEEAISCYSASIAIEPNCIAFANRAMAFLKLKRFKDAESDCTEAIGLDDEYVKAYSRRGTARKELGKLVSAKKDFEKALQFEPENKELKRQLNEIETLIESEKGKQKGEKRPTRVDMVAKSSKIISKSGSPIKRVEQKTELKERPREKAQNELGGEHEKRHSSAEEVVSPLHNSGITEKERVKSQKSETKSCNVLQEPRKEFKQQIEKSEDEMGEQNLSEPRSVNPFRNDSSHRIQSLIQKTMESVKESILRDSEIPANYFEFESKWRLLENDPKSRALYFMKINPESLPEIFKSSFSKQFLMDVFQVLSIHIINENPEFAIRVMENLPKVQRFDMTLFFLSKEEINELKLVLNHRYLQRFSSRINTLKNRYRL